MIFMLLQASFLFFITEKLFFNLIDIAVLVFPIRHTEFSIAPLFTCLEKED